MANHTDGLKPGMAGSKCGKSRRERTAILKKQSKKPRRRQDKQAARLD